MSLITRCPACGTMFKVVSDQLKVSSGWVRCGQCAEVFDASAHMQQPTPVQQTSAAQSDSVAAANIVDVTDSSGSAEIGGSSGLTEEEDGSTNAGMPSPALTLREPESPWAASSSSADQPTFGEGKKTSTNGNGNGNGGQSDFDPMSWKYSMLAASAGEVGVSPQTPDTVATVEKIPAAGLAGAKPKTDPAADSAGLIDPLPEDSVGDAPTTVSFVRDARRKAFWRTPGMRASLALSALVLVVLLLAQVVLQQRDALAAMEPRLKPWLQALCQPMQCELSALRQIDLLVIDNSSFQRLGADGYRLNFSIKNTGSLSVAMPSVEITLTDNQEQPVIRRVISPAQFGAMNPLLPANSSFAGLVAFDVAADDSAGGASSAPNPSRLANPLRVAGYRMLAFYP